MLNKMSNEMKFLTIIIILIILFILFYILITHDYFTNNNTIDNDINISTDIDIIVSRYNENLEWMNEYPFNEFNYIVYNKGIDDNFNKKYIKEIIKTDNVGRCDHTYLYHIINNYDNLAKINIFLPGSLDMTEKNYRSKNLIKYIKKYKRAYFIGNYTDNLKEKWSFPPSSLFREKDSGNKNFS